MTTTLNATTSNGLVVTPDNSGNIQLQYNGVAAPAFVVYYNTGGSGTLVTTNTWTKVPFNTEVYDTANCFDTTNYRFTPSVAGYYQINATAYLYANSGSMSQYGVYIYKNGSQYSQVRSVASATEASVPTSNLIYMNGTTDYIELWAFISSSQPYIYGSLNQNYTYMSGYLARSA
jgi:hypothetical protein